MSAVRRPALYDVTRLVTRGLNAAPNGIDRVDFLLARRFLAQEGAQALIGSLLGPQLAPAERALATSRSIDALWREQESPLAQNDLDGLALAFAGERVAAARVRPIVSRLRRVARNLSAARDWAPYRGVPPSQAPQNAVFINVSTFLIDKPWFMDWLDARPDIAALFFVHDLLPIDYPEFFWEAEARAHPRRLRAALSRAAGFVVGSETTAARLRDFARAGGRPDIPICVAPLPVAAAFAAAAAPDPRLAGAPYFVVCGTIEPRKNHLTLINVWRELAQSRCGPPPKLVIVGKRGWLNENVLGFLDRNEALRADIVESPHLSTPALRALLAGARAALAPSFAEGFGLPLAEALAAKVPVIASNIAVFREIGGEAPDFLDPLDGQGWRNAILDYAAEPSPRREAALRRVEAWRGASPESFFATVERFAQEL